MKAFGRGRLMLGTFAVSTFFTACGGSQPPIGAPGAMPQRQSSAITTHVERGGSWMLPEARATPLLYVANFTTSNGLGDVTEYAAKVNNPSPVITITDGVDSPTGDCADSDGTLYVTNEPISNLGWVSEYAPGQTKPFKTITQGINIPAFCAIDARGNLWVTNISGSVTAYKKGSTKPYAVVTNGVPDPDGIAFDHLGNMYVSNGLGGTGPTINVVVYAPGSKSPSRTIKDGITSPVGIAVDRAATLYVTNIRQNNIKKYRSGQRHPYQTISDGLNLPTAATVTKRGWLYVTNDGNWTILEFPPDSVTPSNREISQGLDAPEGSAYYPPLLP